MQKQAQQPIKGKEEKGPLMQIKLGASKAIAGTSGRDGGGGDGAVKNGGFKKGGFRSAFGSADDEPMEPKPDDNARVDDKKGTGDDDDSDLTDGDDYYDPRKPTDCIPGCKSRFTSAVR